MRFTVEEGSWVVGRRQRFALIDNLNGKTVRDFISRKEANTRAVERNATWIKDLVREVLAEERREGP